MEVHGETLPQHLISGAEKRKANTVESIIWLLVIGGLFYFMMKHGCGAHMGGHGGHGEGHKGHADHTDQGKQELSMSSRKAKDPVCGMDISEEQASAMVRKEGKQIFFCSEACLKKFLGEP